MSDEVCDAEGANGLRCTRHGSEHDTHVTYREKDGQLQHVAWYDCNAIGEPNDE